METAPPPAARPFRFVRYFSLLSLAAIAGVASLLAWLYGWQAESALLEQGEQKNLMQLQLMVNQWSAADRVLVATLLARQEAPATDAPIVDEVARHFAGAVTGTTIRKLKIYTAAGLTVFSSERKQIGERKADYPGIVAALRGSPHSDLSFRNRFEAFGGAIQDVYLIGSYLPLRNAAGAIDGVVEIYDEVTPLALAIRAARWRLVGLTVALMLLLYVALLGVVRRATRIQRHNHALELEVAERTRVTHATQAALAETEAARREAEAARAAADRANRAKSVFLATMSHEIRTPLNGVIGMTEVLLADALTERQRHHLQIVHNSSLSLLRLLSDLLDFSRLEAEPGQLQPTRFALKRLIAELTESMQPRARQRGLALDCRIATDVPEHIAADEARLRQVLGNLLTNALKFTHQGGVTLELARDPAAADKLLFRVHDTGIGIERDHMERIFKPFEQADSTTTRRYGGAGLGLSICRRLVELMGGQIGVDSVAGAGSTFWFTMRFALPDDERAREPAAADDGQALGARILVVEDNAVNQIVAREALAKLGCTATIAASGEQAIEVLRQESFDAVLMDLRMEGIDGAETTRQIRAREARAAGRPLVIVGLTADVFPQTREMCLAAGMNDVLAKPFSRRDLLAALGPLLAPTARATAAAP